jgi:DNA (cytosine-5)-methyltransferase 1
MHAANHPRTHHLCGDVWDVARLQSRAGAGRPAVGVARLHALQQGEGRQAQEQRRSAVSPGSSCDWARAVRPRVICLENVEEFKTGARSGRRHARPGAPRAHVPPNGRPARGAWATSSSGASSARATTARRRSASASSWSRAATASRSSGRRRRTDRAAAAVSHGGRVHRLVAACPSIFERKKPLADKTPAADRARHPALRPRRGEPFIVRIGHTGHGDGGKTHGVDVPLSTITAKAELALLARRRWCRPATASAQARPRASLASTSRSAPRRRRSEARARRRVPGEALRRQRDAGRGRRAGQHDHDAGSPRTS